MSVILFPDSIKLIHDSFATAAVSNAEAFSTMNSWEKLIWTQNQDNSYLSQPL